MILHTDREFFFGELCLEKAVVAYAKPQQRKKEEGERLRGGRDQIKFIDLGFERWQVVGFRKSLRVLTRDFSFFYLSR